MMHKIYFFLLFFPTLVLAQGNTDLQDHSYEMTYEELSQELSMKKKSNDPFSKSHFGLENFSAIVGYSFSTIGLKLKTGSGHFMLNGIDVRGSGLLVNSKWRLEGGFKNYSKITNGKESAELRIFTTSLRTQDILTQDISYSFGVGASLNWITARDELTHYREIESSLNVLGGIRGNINDQLTWGIDLNTHSPLSASKINQFLEASFLLTTLL
jgi:hypothetical protein